MFCFFVLRYVPPLLFTLSLQLPDISVFSEHQTRHTAQHAQNEEQHRGAASLTDTK